MKQTRFRALSFLLIGLLVLPLLIALSFSSNPQFNNGDLVFTDDTLTCAWTYSGDTIAQNISIFQGSTLILNQYETGGLNTSVSLISSNTTKNQGWSCVVVLENATANITSSTNITIQNSAPETPTVYNSSNSDIGTTYNVTEDTSYSFDVNSSDLDLDTLTYYFKAATQGFCTMNDEDNGLATCTPTQSYHNESPTNVNITFWVDDDDSIFAKSASLKVTFTVIPVNDAPQATLTTQTSPVNTTLTYDFDATDEENNFPLTFELINVPSEISGKVSIASLDNDSARFVYNASTPDYNDVNTTGWNISVNITDANGSSSTSSFLLNLTAVGRAPQIINFTPSPVSNQYTLNQGEFIQINITANDSDSGDIHSYFDNTAKPTFSTTTLEGNTSINGNSTGQVNFTATNDDVGQFTVTISVYDQELLSTSIDLNFTVLNVNDAPVLSEISTNSSNTNSNTNASNLTAYVGAPFIFVINATDVDVQYADTLTFSDNTSLFAINTSTGVINFTPNSSDIGEYSINITVVDNQSEQDSITLTLSINANTNPYFNPYPLANLSCAESVLCTYDVSTYATDDDISDSVVSYLMTSDYSGFSYNDTTGAVSFTPNQTDIGNYSVNITIYDEQGAANTTSISLQINNTDDTPVLTRYDFSSSLIVENFLFLYQLQAQDADLLASVGENLTFSTNLSFVNITSYSTTDNQTSAYLTFVPTSGEVGTHTINISVNDTSGLLDSQVFSFTILAETDPPNISQIQPYGNTSNSSFPVTSFISTASLSSNSTALVFPENNTYTFAHITTDDTTATNSLNTTWYYDNVEVATSWNYTRTFNFSSSGSHTVKLVVNDSTYEQSVFSWNLTVNNVNREPQLLNNLTSSIELNSTTIYSDFLTRYLSVQRFLDPDDDTDEDDFLDLSETNTIVFTATTCVSGSTTIAAITITGGSITIDPQNEGTCSVIFTATDASSASLQSNIVTINVTEQPEGSEETVTTTTTSSGGGGSTSRSSFIPITTETETPQAVNIIAPKLVYLYENDSIVIPFDVENTWTDDLEFIELSARTNNTDIEVSLSSNLIERLTPNESVEVLLEVKNYRLGDNYEVELVANVSNPEFSDAATILLSSIEQASKGDEVEVKVTFARDLLNEHPECQELNELLDKANEELKKQNYEEANRYVDTAINGCKYVVSTLKQRSERPDSLSNLLVLDEVTLATLIYGALAFVVLSTVAFIIYYHYTNKEDDDI